MSEVLQISRKLADGKRGFGWRCRRLPAGFGGYGRRVARKFLQNDDADRVFPRKLYLSAAITRFAANTWLPFKRMSNAPVGRVFRRKCLPQRTLHNRSTGAGGGSMGSRFELVADMATLRKRLRSSVSL